MDNGLKEGEEPAFSVSVAWMRLLEKLSKWSHY